MEAVSPEAAFVLTIVIVFLVAILITTYKKLQAIRKKLRPIIPVKKEIEKLTNKRNSIAEEIEKLKSDYTKECTVFENLKEETKKLTNKQNIITDKIKKIKSHYTEECKTLERLKEMEWQENDRMRFGTFVYKLLLIPLTIHNLT